MNGIPSTPNNLITRNSNKYQKCARKGCPNIGNNHVEIIYIKKVGWFCDACATELKKAVFS